MRIRGMRIPNFQMIEANLSKVHSEMRLRRLEI